MSDTATTTPTGYLTKQGWTTEPPTDVFAIWAVKCPTCNSQVDRGHSTSAITALMLHRSYYEH